MPTIRLPAGYSYQHHPTAYCDLLIACYFPVPLSPQSSVDDDMTMICRRVARRLGIIVLTAEDTLSSAECSTRSNVRLRAVHGSACRPSAAPYECVLAQAVDTGKGSFSYSRISDVHLPNANLHHETKRRADASISATRDCPKLHRWQPTDAWNKSQQQPPSLLCTDFHSIGSAID